jgi:hypothetical protein
VVGCVKSLVLDEVGMLGYYVLAFDGDSFENVVYPAMRRAYYMNDFGPLERAAVDYPQLQTYLEFAREWSERGCRRPMKLFTKGICEYNVKSPGVARIVPPDPARGDTTGWEQLLEVLEQEGQCTLIGVPCGQNRVIHTDLMNLCRYTTARGRPWELGTPAQRNFIYPAPADEGYATFVDLLAGHLSAAVAAPADILRLLRKFSRAFSTDLELHYTPDQTSFLGYLAQGDVRTLYTALAETRLDDPLAEQYLECLRGFLSDALMHESGMVLEVA